MLVMWAQMLPRAHEDFRHLILYLEQRFQTCLALEVSKHYPRSLNNNQFLQIFIHSQEFNAPASFGDVHQIFIFCIHLYAGKIVIKVY